jgi:hypothetical protein
MKAWLLVTMMPMMLLADDDRKTESWLRAISHVLGQAVRPTVVITTTTAPVPVVYVQPAPPPGPPVVYIQQPVPQPVVVVATPVVYVPESYVWNGYEYIGWVGDQYVYYNGVRWYPCRPVHMAHL